LQAAHNATAYGGQMPVVQFIDLNPTIKADARGMSFFPWQGRLQKPGELLQTFHLVSIQPGTIRGNHLHPGHAEWLYPFHGAAVFIWESDPGQIQERLISGDRTLIYTPPGVAHALKNPGPEILYLLAWRELSGSELTGPETVPCNLAD
jgi:dTDP-4-dehydrorhamnose 3,5-epimerase-like enzyme